jgi:hypothetical protein
MLNLCIRQAHRVPLLIAQVVNGEESKYLCDPVSCIEDRYTWARLVGHTTAQDILDAYQHNSELGRLSSGLFYLAEVSTHHLFTSTAFMHTLEGRTYALVCLLPSGRHTTLERAPHLSSFLLTLQPRSSPPLSLYQCLASLETPPMHFCTRRERGGVIVDRANAGERTSSGHVV